jgi:hypothetical protein
MTSTTSAPQALMTTAGDKTRRLQILGTVERAGVCHVARMRIWASNAAGEMSPTGASVYFRGAELAGLRAWLEQAEREIAGLDASITSEPSTLLADRTK